MGQRANLVIVTPAPEYELFYTHWRANSLDCELFWGPSEALEFARRQRSRAEGAAWLDEVWAEGGAVIDTVRRELLWFGGEDLRFDVPMRRIHQRLMRQIWRGWTVRWATEGVADMARYVGVPVQSLLVASREPPDPSLAEMTLREPEEPDWISGVISFRDSSGRLGFFPFDGFADDVAESGPPLVDALRRATLSERFDCAARSDTFPASGIHIDETDRVVEVWLSPPRADYERRFRAVWPDWTARWVGDRFETQLERCGGRLAFPTASDDALIARIRDLVLRPTRDHRDVFGNALRHVEPGAKVQINAFALRDDPPPAPTPAHAEAFVRAVEREFGQQSR